MIFPNFKEPTVSLDEHRKDDRAVVLFHYRDALGRRWRSGRWITHIGPGPIELGQGVKAIGRSATPELYEVAAIGREGFHLVVDLRKPTRPPGCVTYWPELRVGWNVVSKDEPWLARSPR